jgi:inhibitor of cysteine peptidase
MKRGLAGALFVAVVGVGCGSDATSGLRPNTPAALLQVVDVEVAVLESFPPQVVANVKGKGPEGCTVVDLVQQARRGNTVEVTITTARAGEFCTQVVIDIEHAVRLEGGFAPGEYLLRVNGVERRFRV